VNGRTHFGPYRVTSRIGAGGMGEVFRAQDPRLNRDVAIKVLPADRSNPEAAARLVREARLVAALNHPGILTIHDVGEEDGQFYLVTELLEGETLRDRLAGGALPWRIALEFSNTIASALAAAHAKGVVHRDLKPDNIFCLSSGSVKILDFGIAKFVAPPNAATVTAPVANTRGVFGTVAYMSPEQLEGREVDHRTDQYSLGVVMHEMMAGQRPVDGSTLPSGVPTPFTRVVTRCLSRDPEGRYASTADLAMALDDVRTDVHQPVAAVSPKRKTLSWVAASLVLVALLAAAAIGWRRMGDAPAPRAAASSGDQAIAVLPFSTIGEGEPYLADGVTEAVTRELGRVEHIRVIASNTAFNYRSRGDAIIEIAKELGVGQIVRGSIQRAPDKVRISAELIDANGGAVLWSDRYDRGATDVLAVQDEIAWQIAAKLAAAFGHPAPARPQSTVRANPEAYDAYLRGLWYQHGRSAIRDLSQYLDAAIKEYERAITLDTNFALARASLASAYGMHFFYDATDPAYEQRALVEIQRALAINPDLAEAYLARAQITWNMRNGFHHESAIADLKRAVATNPNLADAHLELCRVYGHIGLADKAIAECSEAIALDPLSTAATARRFATYLSARMADKAREEAERIPQLLASTRGRAAFAELTGHPEDALKAFGDLALPNPSDGALRKTEMNDLAYLAHCYARAGRTADANHALRVVIPMAVNPTGLSDIHHAQFEIGVAQALLGRKDDAVLWLNKAASEGLPAYPEYANQPDLASLKGHPGFDALLERLRLDHERWMKTL
jgi:serine/threonine-protein kinase